MLQITHWNSCGSALTIVEPGGRGTKWGLALAGYIICLPFICTTNGYY